MTQKSEIIIYHHYEVTDEGHGAYLVMTDMAGQTYRIAEKRSAAWIPIQEAKAGEPILLIYDSYKGTDYISNTRALKDELLSNAVARMAEKLQDPITEQRNRSQAISYAKDLCCADKIEIEGIFNTARDIYDFIMGQKDDSN